MSVKHPNVSRKMPAEKNNIVIAKIPSSVLTNVKSKVIVVMGSNVFMVDVSNPNATMILIAILCLIITAMVGSVCQEMQLSPFVITYNVRKIITVILREDVL